MSNARKILWFSNDDLTTEQLDDLTRIYGPVTISHFSGTVSAQEIVELADTVKADILAVLVPTTVLVELTNDAINKRPVIRATSKRVSTGKKKFNPTTGINEDEYYFKHAGWEQVKVKIICETMPL